MLGLGFAPDDPSGLTALAPLLSVKSPLAVTTPLTLGMLARVIAPVTIGGYTRAFTPAAASVLPVRAAPRSVRPAANVTSLLILILVNYLDTPGAAHMSGLASAPVAASMWSARSTLRSGGSPTIAASRRPLRVLAHRRVILPRRAASFGPPP